MKVDINGIDLEVMKQGNGETILFVHGSNGDYRTWNAQQSEFAKHFHTISYSRRYHYPNEKITEDADYAMVEHLDDLQKFIQSLDGKPVHLAGHSYGAFLSLLLAIREPQLIRTLILEEPPIFTLFITIPPKPQEILKLLVTRPQTAIAIIRFAMTGLNPATVAAERDDMDEALRIFGSAILGTETYNKMSPERLEQARINNFKAELLGSGFMPLDETHVSHIQTPTLLINGANSPALFHRFIDRLHELLPHSERIKISDASHIIHEDNPTAYNKAVLSFIEQN